MSHEKQLNNFNNQDQPALYNKMEEQIKYFETNITIKN